MRNAKIFLVGKKEGELMPMVETPYEREDILQVLLARYHDLLAGDQINPEDPLRWLFIKREVGIPSEKEGSSIWSIDHLFLDHIGIPTFVECKRAADTRSRREVVAQMLDYAANGIKYWSIDKLRQSAAETAQSQNKSLDEEIRRLIGSDDEPDVENYWEEVENNLRNGKVRLIFVADETSGELRRLVEFLNAKMVDVEVLAVEVKQFLGKDQQKAIVPRVIGLTQAIRDTKSPERYTSPEEFLSKCDPISANFFNSVITSARERGHVIYLGQKGISIRARFYEDDKVYTFIYGHPGGGFDFYFGWPMDTEEESSLRKRLISYGVFQESGKKTLKAKVTEETVERLKEVYAFILDEIEQVAKKGGT